MRVSLSSISFTSITLGSLTVDTSTDNSEINDADAVEHFAWIPQAILHCLQTKDIPPEFRTSITSIFKGHILPLPSQTDEEQAWVDRLLLVASGLDEAAFIGLERTTGLVGFAMYVTSLFSLQWHFPSGLPLSSTVAVLTSGDPHHIARTSLHARTTMCVVALTLAFDIVARADHRAELSTKMRS